jgi:uncharacterized heparinase superfamily protein
MYHAVVLEQLLDVLNLMAVFPETTSGGGRAAQLPAVVPRMLDWLTAMTHPDGGTSFFNDSTMGVAATCEELFDYAGRLGFPVLRRPFTEVHRLRESGFFRLSSRDGRTVALLDVGAPAPGYQPGHSHSECLSFELSRDGRRLFVNAGVSTYELGPSRTWQRATAAHNTMRIDDEEQSELWASHRCGRRAHVVNAGESGGWAYASHTGYSRLHGAPVHTRRMRVGDGGVEIVDKIAGGGEHLMEWFFHLHPDVTARAGERSVELLVDGRLVASVAFPFGAVATVAGGSWYPGFNVSAPNAVVHVALRASLPFEFTTTITWS